MYFNCLILCHYKQYQNDTLYCINYTGYINHYYLSMKTDGFARGLPIGRPILLAGPLPGAGAEVGERYFS